MWQFNSNCCQAILTFLSLHTTQKYGNKTTYLLSSILSEYFAEAGVLLSEITLEALSYVFILIPHPWKCIHPLSQKSSARALPVVVMQHSLLFQTLLILTYSLFYLRLKSLRHATFQCGEYSLQWLSFSVWRLKALTWKLLETITASFWISV